MAPNSGLTDEFPPRAAEYLSPGIDDHGRIFKLDGLLLRALTASGQRIFDYMNKSGIYDRLVDVGLVESEMTSLHPGTYSSVVKHRKLPFVSYALEWPLEMLKQAALLQCRLTRELLRVRLATQDAHPKNIVFDFTRPMFVDLGSISFADDISVPFWIKEFREHFYLPLWLAARKRGSLPRWYIKERGKGPIKDVMTQTVLKRACLTFNRVAGKATKKGFDYFLSALLEHLEGMNVSPPAEPGPKYIQSHWDTQLLVDIVRSCNASSLIDMAATNGVYSMLAADLGVPVVAFDINEHFIGELYKRAQAGQKPILPLVMELLRPTPPGGIGLLDPSSYERLRCDVGLALNRVNHLAITNGVGFDTIAPIISRYVQRGAVVEFVPPSDDEVVALLRGRTEQYSRYTEDEFVRAFMKQFRSCASWAHPLNGRKLFFFEH